VQLRAGTFVDTLTCSYVCSHLPRLGTLLTPTSSSTDAFTALFYPHRRAGRPLSSPSHASNLVEQSFTARTLLKLSMDSDFDIVDGVWRTAPTCCPPPRLIKNNPIPPEAFAMPPWNIRPPSLRSTGDEQTHVEPEIVANTISSDNNPVRSSQSTHQEPPLVFENDDVSGPNDNPGPFPPQVWSYPCLLYLLTNLL
jgi:hypothetical protein